MAYTPVPAVSAGDWIDEVFINTYWVDNFAAGVPDLFTAKGQLPVGLGVDSMGVLNVGADGTVLMADSAEPLGMRWAHASMFLIEEQQLGASVASVTFSSIPASYIDLVLKYYVRIGSAGIGADQLRMQLNGDAGNNYDYGVSALTGATLTGTAQTLQNNLSVAFVCGNGCVAGAYGAGDVTLPRYASRANNLTTYGYGGMYYTGTTINISHSTGQWRSSAAVNTILLWGNGGNILGGSKFALYGIR